MKPMLLIVDDEKTQREGLRAVLEDHYEVYIADSAASAIELLESDSFDVLLTDFRMPGEDGLKLIKRAKSLAQPPVCILMTAFGSEETAVQAIKEGADDYLPKGSMLIDDLEKKIQRSLKLRRLEEENIVLKQQLGKRFQTSNIVGESPAMRGVFDMVEQVAPTNATVLILGESGTGKELIAKAIHQSSHRAHHAMVTVHCAGLSPTLLESELFGHEKGAFTGAITARVGRFEMAEGGTLFLDEIGDMPLNMQVKILRVLQERTFERVGSNRTQSADVRVIAATHKHLEDMIESGDFREDLYYRLNVFPSEMPALRDRVEDIPLLINELISRMEKEKRGSLRMNSAAIMSLCRHDWPGNVRELANLVERLSIMHPYGVIGVQELPKKFRYVDDYDENRPVEDTGMPSGIPGLVGLDAPALLPVNGIDLKDYLSNLEKQLIQQALDEAGGVVARAAEKLRIRRTTLVEKVRKYGLREEESEDS